MALTTRFIPPPDTLSDFVSGFWELHNPSAAGCEVVILPDGCIDLFFSESAVEPFHITRLGLGTHAARAVVAPGTRTFAVSFRPLAAEYVFGASFAGLLDGAENLPAGFWGFGPDDLLDFDRFRDKASLKIAQLAEGKIDGRKQKLFRLLCDTNGAAGVKELSDRVSWSSRQINRYFNRQLGVPLKTYCGILRFRAALGQLREGKLFPEHDFADQSHFIREVKKLSGVVPKELSRNQNDRFIQFSTLPGP